VLRKNLPDCIGTRRPYPPNDCRTRRYHANYTCSDIVAVASGGGRVRPVPRRQEQ